MILSREDGDRNFYDPEAEKEEQLEEQENYYKKLYGEDTFEH